MNPSAWLDDIGVFALPSGARVRGRRVGDVVSPADFALILAEGPAPEWPFRLIIWPDFRVPADTDDALDALREAHRRARGGERVEAACRGGKGRTGTALAALAVLDGLPPDEAVRWVRRGYHPRAVETFGQRRWLRKVWASVVGVRSERAMSFGAIADEYNRLRPSPPRSAIDWLVPDGCRVAIDLAAGTGLLTRALLAKVPEVIAVEPDDRMASVLREHTPGVRVVTGKGEAIPLETASADGLFISSAWHWLDPELAIPEIARVLRDGGRFGAIWTSRDRHVDWVREMDQLREPGRFRARSDLQAGDDAGALPGGRPSGREVRLPAGSPFKDAQTASFTFTRVMTTDDFVEMLGTYSGIITASPEDRAAAMARVRGAVDARFPGADQIDVPMRSLCWRADRVSR